LHIGSSVKFWIAVSLASLFIFNAYWVYKSYENFFGFLLGSPQQYGYVSFLGAAFWAGHIGLTARFAAIAAGLVAAYLLWVKKQPFLKVKGWVAGALVLEAVNFIGLIPSTWTLLNPASFIFSTSLGLGYLLQVISTAPFLLTLAWKTKKYAPGGSSLGLHKWAAVALAGYVFSLVANEVSRWASMISLDNTSFLFEGVRAIGFLNAVAFMPIAVIFAVAGAWFASKNNLKHALSLVGTSLAIVGLHYIIYLGYSAYTNSLNFALLVDIWTVPLFCLGLVLIIENWRSS
jgi:hypothetical protein